MLQYDGSHVTPQYVLYRHMHCTYYTVSRNLHKVAADENWKSWNPSTVQPLVGSNSSSFRLRQPCVSYERQYSTYSAYVCTVQWWYRRWWLGCMNGDVGGLPWKWWNYLSFNFIIEILNLTTLLFHPEYFERELLMTWMHEWRCWKITMKMVELFKF